MDSDEVTRLLEAAGSDGDAAGQLLPLVYDDLRVAAARHMRHERSDHTLDATALVHEAYLRLVGNRKLPWANRAHFYAAAAEAMRRILLDHARGRGRQKRGGGRRREPLGLLDLAASPDAANIVAFDQAFRRLEEEDAQAAAVVRFRFFAGLGVRETADALGVSTRTVNRAWSYARAWLHDALAGSADLEEPGEADDRVNRPDLNAT